MFILVHAKVVESPASVTAKDIAEALILDMKEEATQTQAGLVRNAFSKGDAPWLKAGLIPDRPGGYRIDARRIVSARRP
ncbi:MAG: hypothetical protein K9K64_13640 [Desulfohalobiaceae bacterium]|nr:hypothetical protein [Desulfohalobiaceae bacterium]